MDQPLFPQRPTDAHAEVLSVDWLFEPYWPGQRLMVRIWNGHAEAFDERGERVGPELDEVARLVAPAVMTSRAVVDGVWTAQPFVGDGSPARAWAETIASEGLAEDVPDPLESERRRAFVAVDLVELDGEPLFDVPFQERRRLLESVIDEGVQVRVSPVVKQPIGGWLVGWRANGFTHYLAKHQNSHYDPGSRCDDWLKLPLEARAPRGLIGRLIGRGERIRRIRD